MIILPFLYFAKIFFDCIGNYTMEPVLDLDWNILAYASLLIYHFIFLQILSLVRNELIFDVTF